MNNFVKKIAAALAVVLGVTSFVGCGSKEGVDNTKPETEVEENKEEVKEEEKKEEVVEEEEKKEEVVEEEKKEEIKEEPKEEVVEKVEVQKEEPKKEEPKKEEPKKEEPKKEEPKKEPQVEVYNMAGQLGKVTVSSSLNVRSKPSTSASVVKSLSNGSLVALQEGYSNGWYKVNLPNNKVGYVSNKYVKVIDTAEKYLTSDVKINGIVIKKGELVTIVGSNGENFICKYKDLNFEISGQILSSYKSENPPKQEKPQSKPQAGKQIATYTTYYDASVKGRSQNIALASKAISVRLEPGQEFVWSRIVGKASSEKGYKPAPVFSGNKVVQGVGGGVCQVSTTLYGAVLNAGMKVTERHRHSMPVTYGEPGKDATVSYGSLDFRFINTKDYPVQIVATANGGTLTVTFNRAN